MESQAHVGTGLLVPAHTVDKSTHDPSQLLRVMIASGCGYSEGEDHDAEGAWRRGWDGPLSEDDG